MEFIVLSTEGYSYYLWNKTASTVANIHENINKSKHDSAVDIDKHDPFSVLLKNVDDRDGDKERADYLIYMTVNPKTKTTEMVSIPRDTEIISIGKMDKINHLYAFGGVQMTADTVDNFLDVSVDYFVKVNMESFREA